MDINELYSYIEDFTPLIQNIENLDADTLTEVYEIQKILIQTVISNIETFGVATRDLLCKRQDLILNQISKFPLSFDTDSIHNIYTLAIDSLRSYNNDELMKDIGLAGYFLGKEFNAKANMMYCSKSKAYPFHKYIPEVELIFADEETPLKEQYLNYIVNNISKFDALLFHGLYPNTAIFINLFRQYRPDAKIYLALDMNSTWMKRIDWNDPTIMTALSNCDFIATSSLKIRDMLNNSTFTNFPCFHISNAFSNIANLNIVAKPEVKKNIILTVGRIGNYDKNNMELMLAFATIAHLIPDWTLRIVGGIEPQFEDDIEKYFNALPDLRNQIVFTGEINDKQALYDEYAQAKCFALTSIVEGGTPNVYAEALNHGCMFIFSNIDAAEEMTNNGELGQVYKSGNIDELAGCILRMAYISDEEHFKVHIPKALKYAEDVFDWNKNVKKLAFALTH